MGNWAFIALLLIIYFLIGSKIADYLEKDDDIMAMIVFIAWPAIVVILVVYLCVMFVKNLRDAIDERM